jgi:hypothetical protein
MRHFTIILVVLNFSNCGFLLYFVYPLSFRDKNGEYILFCTGNVFPNRSSFFFVPEWPKEEFVNILYWQHSGCQKHFM